MEKNGSNSSKIEIFFFQIPKDFYDDWGCLLQQRTLVPVKTCHLGLHPTHNFNSIHMHKDPSCGHSLCETIKFLAKFKESIFQPTMNFFIKKNMFCHHFSHNAKHLRASPMVVLKNISHVQVIVIYTLCNPTHKTRTRIANRWDSGDYW